MSDPHWLREAKALPFGHKKKILCCGASPSMIVNHDRKGYSAHCFRDSDHGGFVAHGTLSLKQLAERADARTALQSGAIALPADFTHEVPDIGRLWLLRASIDGALSRHYGIGYSPSADRVIVPVFEDGVLSAFTARALGKVTPKYIARQNSASTLFWSDPAVQLPETRVEGNVVVLTEDALSSIRVGRVVQSAALMGTSLSEEQVHAIYTRLGSDATVLLWLDGDKAGKKGRDRIARRMSLRGLRVLKVTTALDPKKYSNQQIKEILLDRLGDPSVDAGA